LHPLQGHAGDCPQRNERQPWLGDRATGQPGRVFYLITQSFMQEWLDDIQQSQTEEGLFPM